MYVSEPGETYFERAILIEINQGILVSQREYSQSDTRATRFGGGMLIRRNGSGAYYRVRCLVDNVASDSTFAIKWISVGYI